MLCCGHLDEKLLHLVAERLRAKRTQETLQCRREVLEFLGSVGLRLSDIANMDWKTIYARADAALYKMKASGNNCVMFGNTASFGATGKYRTLRVVKP